MIRAIIVEDEKPTLNRLKRQINAGGVAETVGAFTRPAEALEFLKDNSVDAAFLDIEMPGMSGLELAERITDMQPEVSVVFITAYNQYAVEAFRLNAIDYLLKPVTDALLLESLARVKREIRPRASAEPLSIKCFGKFTVRAGEGEINFRTEKTKELLAFLIAQNGAFVSRDAILDNLWEGFDGDRALINFNSTLYNLRKAFLPFRSDVRIIYESGCYRLSAENMRCDYWEFYRAAEEKEPVTQENKTELENAVSLYSGEYFAGLNSLWTVQKRFRSSNLYVGLITRLAGFYLNTGDTKRAYGILNEGLEKEPLNRELNYLIIKLLISDNERTKAERYYGAYKEALLKLYKEMPDEGIRKLMKN